MSKSILLLLLTVGFRVTLPAQTTMATPGSHDPAFLNHVYFWAPDSLLALEKTNGEMKAKMMIKLYQLDPQKKTREAVISSQGGMFNKSSKTNSGIDYNIQKSGADVYILLPTTRLAPGEYGFMNMMQATSSGTQISYAFFTFGIDP